MEFELVALFALIGDFLRGLPYGSIARYILFGVLFAVVVALVFGEQIIDFFSNVEDRIDSGTELEQ